MKNRVWLKSIFNPPRKLELRDLVLEALAPKHNQLDYEAWNSSREELIGIFGPRNGWPGEVSSLEHNLKDLENHLREFNEKEAYTYTLLSKDEKMCLGCLYIRPTRARGVDCRVDFWFRSSHKKLESDFYQWLQSWLKSEWMFENVAYPGRSLSWREYYDFTDSMTFFKAQEYQRKVIDLYDGLSSKIRKVLPKAQIEHIGSSAIPGAISKGDLDIYVGVQTRDFQFSLNQILKLNYKIKEETFRSSELCMLEGSLDGIDVGIQLVDSKSKFTDFLLFRSLLKKSPNLVREYNQLKMEATGLSPFEYREIKSKFIENILSLGKLNDKELAFWNTYMKTLDQKPMNVRVEAGIAGSEEIADNLLHLYLTGKKSAGSGLVKDYEIAHDRLPEVGNYWIILNSKKEPKCIVKTVGVEFYQFDEVPEEVAIAEGEGDLSLKYWRKAHIEFFTPFLKDWEIQDLDKETLVTEFYEVVYK